MVTTHAPMTRAVASALRAASPERQDAGAVQLAREYAGLIDNAATTAKYRPHINGLRLALDQLATLGGIDESDRALEHLEKITTALAEHSVASDLGPKLLAALTALGLTPAGRGIKGGQNGAPTANPLDELKARRANRAERAREH